MYIDDNDPSRYGDNPMGYGDNSEEYGDNPGGYSDNICMVSFFVLCPSHAFTHTRIIAIDLHKSIM